MKLAVAAVMAFVASSVQLRPSVSHTGGIQISDYFKNHTFPATGFNAVQDVTTLAHELPPALPQHPVLRVFGESFLPLGPSAHDDAWERVKCKGANFVRAMRGSDREAGTLFSPPLDSAASQFDVGFEAQKWGWDIKDNLHAGKFADWGMAGILRDLGSSDSCSDEGGTIECLTFVHGYPYVTSEGHWVDIDRQRYVVDGRTYRKTGAHYGLGFDLVNGIIIAMDRESPQSAGNDRTPPVVGDELPAVRSCSDIAWIGWESYAEELKIDVKNIKYFLSLSITNIQTHAIISRVIGETVPGSEGYPAWGGFEYDTNTPEGQAILGTPNAQAFSYFLLQHKAELGNLYISKVRVFHDSREVPGPVLLLIVDPVPEGGGMTGVDDQQNKEGVGRLRRHTRNLKMSAKL